MDCFDRQDYERLKQNERCACPNCHAQGQCTIVRLPSERKMEYYLLKCKACGHQYDLHQDFMP